jgi:hypothetical protein
MKKRRNSKPGIIKAVSVNESRANKEIRKQRQVYKILENTTHNLNELIFPRYLVHIEERNS